MFFRVKTLLGQCGVRRCRSHFSSVSLPECKGSVFTPIKLIYRETLPIHCSAASHHSARIGSNLYPNNYRYRKVYVFRVKTLLGQCGVRRCRSHQQRLTILLELELNLFPNNYLYLKVYVFRVKTLLGRCKLKNLSV